jgi:hypothetical protein
LQKVESGPKISGEKKSVRARPAAGGVTQNPD